MADVPRNDPIALLQDIEHKARQHAAGLPQQVALKTPWLAIAFKIGDVQLVSPVDEVGEILHYPPLSRIPGTKSWVRGIANVRGNLLPIMDLKDYLTRQTTGLTPRSRVLVVDHEGVFVGLLVDAVLGLKHFMDDERTRKLPDVPDFIRSYLAGAYQQDGQDWGVFSMHALAKSPLFMQAAV